MANAHSEHGLGGPRPRKATGAAPKVPDRLAAEARRWVIDGPAACGPDRVNWTYAGLAGHLYQTRGVAAGRSAVLRFCKKLRVRACRPAYRSLRADPAKLATARAELADLQKGRPRGDSRCRAGTRPGSRWCRPSPRRRA